MSGQNNEEKKDGDPEFMQDERYKNLDPRVKLLLNTLDGRTH